MGRILHALAADGFEYLGTFDLGGAVVVGDPTLLSRMPANGAYHAAPTQRGTWHVLGRPDDADADVLAEVVFVAEEALPEFWDLYDRADFSEEIPDPSGRLLVLDAVRKDDAAVRQSAFEPEEDGLPWLLDRGVVLRGDPLHPVRVFGATAGATSDSGPRPDKLALLALNFGRAPAVRVGRSLDDAS